MTARARMLFGGALALVAAQAQAADGFAEGGAR